MTDLHLYLAIGIQVLINAAALGVVAMLLISHMNARFDAVNTRFDHMRDLWRLELHRVEEVVDARLKHLEER